MEAKYPCTARFHCPAAAEGLGHDGLDVDDPLVPAAGGLEARQRVDDQPSAGLGQRGPDTPVQYVLGGSPANELYTGAGCSASTFTAGCIAVIGNPPGAISNDAYLELTDAYGSLGADLEREGRPIGPNDLLIAATALTHSLTLVTHNTSEFSRVPGLKVEDWESMAG